MNFIARLLSYLRRTNDTRFYYLALIKETPDADWSIHGLWPNLPSLRSGVSESSYPTYCKKVEFDINELESIIDELKKYWHSDSGSDEEFWRHEYSKHGSCMFIDVTEYKYFKMTLDLYKKFKIAASKYQTSETTAKIKLDLNFNLIC